MISVPLISWNPPSEDFFVFSYGYMCVCVRKTVFFLGKKYRISTEKVPYLSLSIDESQTFHNHYIFG